MGKDIEYNANEYLNRHKGEKMGWSDQTWKKIDNTVFGVLIVLLLIMLLGFPKLVEWKVNQITKRVVRQEVDLYLSELGEGLLHRDVRDSYKVKKVPQEELQSALEYSESMWDEIQSTLPAIEGEVK